jgi:hypothetical protein
MNEDVRPLRSYAAFSGWHRVQLEPLTDERYVRIFFESGSVITCEIAASDIKITPANQR